jgi:hypothetical protein
MVNLSHFMLMKVLDKFRGSSGDEYVIMLKSFWPADQIERMKMGRHGIQRYENFLSQPERLVRLRKRNRPPM